MGIEPEGPSPWDVSLGDLGDDGSPGPRAAGTPDLVQDPGSPFRRSVSRERGVLGVVLLLIALTWVPGLVRGDPPPPQPVVAVLGTRMGVPMTLRLPAGAKATADNRYVGMRLPEGGAVMVIIPTEVVDPAGGRTPIPADPAAWLQDNPNVFVSRVTTVRVGTVQARQVDYRRSGQAEPVSRFAALQLFCGWSGEATRPAYGSRVATPPQACTGVTSDARVRATFIPVDGRTVLVEMVWRVGDGPSWPMPQALRRTYTDLLASLTTGA